MIDAAISELKRVVDAACDEWSEEARKAAAEAKRRKSKSYKAATEYKKYPGRIAIQKLDKVTSEKGGMRSPEAKSEVRKLAESHGANAEQQAKSGWASQAGMSASEAAHWARKLLRKSSDADILDLARALDVTPPGGEAMVRALKKEGEVDNPWAVAWAAKNRGEI